MSIFPYFHYSRNLQIKKILGSKYTFVRCLGLNLLFYKDTCNNVRNFVLFFQATNMQILQKKKKKTYICCCDKPICSEGYDFGACAINWNVKFRGNYRVIMHIKEKKHFFFWKRRREGFSRSWVASGEREEKEKTCVKQKRPEKRGMCIYLEIIGIKPSPQFIL